MERRGDGRMPLVSISEGRIFLLGVPHRLVVRASVWRGVSCETEEVRVTLADPADAEAVRSLVDAWLDQQAAAFLPRVLSEEMTRFRQHITNARCPLTMREESSGQGIRLTVRRMRTRWGSCSRDGHITLNRDLVHVPRALIDYVVLHEVCHLVHLNHSPAFYFQLARCLPDWRERRRELASGAWGQTRSAE